MNKPLPPSKDAIDARKRRRRNFAIPKIYQRDYEEPEDDWQDAIRVDFQRSELDFNIGD